MEQTDHGAVRSPDDGVSGVDQIDAARRIRLSGSGGQRATDSTPKRCPHADVPDLYSVLICTLYRSPYSTDRLSISDAKGRSASRAAGRMLRLRSNVQNDRGALENGAYKLPSQLSACSPDRLRTVGEQRSC